MPTIFWLWLAAAAIFLIVEIGTPTLVFACFVVGAIGAAVASTMELSYLVQLGVFAGISIILIPLTRPLARKITKPSPQPTNIDAIIGKTGVVTKAIDNAHGTGQIQVDGQIWQARSDVSLEPGVNIRVDKIIGATAHVSKIN